MWSILDSAADNSGVPGPLVQMSFDLDGNHYTAREQITGETQAEIAGMYYDWTVQNDIVLSNWGNAAGKYCRYIGENEYADLCTWHDIDTSGKQSLTTPQPMKPQHKLSGRSSYELFRTESMPLMKPPIRNSPGTLQC